MAILLNLNQKGSIKVVLKRDDAIDLEKSDYDLYVNNGCNEDHLKFIENKQPTRFVLKKTLSFEEQQLLLSKQVKIRPDSSGKMNQEFDISYIFDEIRACLVDIENPSYLDKSLCLEFKKDSDGKASKELISFLHNAGVLFDLYGARQAALSQSQEQVENLKKN